MCSSGGACPPTRASPSPSTGSKFHLSEISNVDMSRLADQWSLYNDWARGDNNLDWAGAEQGQGQHNGQSALGTPAGQEIAAIF